MEQINNVKMSNQRKMFHVELKFKLKKTSSIHTIINMNSASESIYRTNIFKDNADRILISKFQRSMKYHDFDYFIKHLIHLALKGSDYQLREKSKRLLNRLKSRNIIPEWQPKIHQPWCTTKFTGEI